MIRGHNLRFGTWHGDRGLFLGERVKGVVSVTTNQEQCAARGRLGAMFSSPVRIAKQPKFTVPYFVSDEALRVSIQTRVDITD